MERIKSKIIINNSTKKIIYKKINTILTVHSVYSDTHLPDENIACHLHSLGQVDTILVNK